MQKIKEATFVTYKNHRSEPYFKFIKNGEKTVEGRLRKGLYKDVKINDHIVVCTNDETDSVEVVVRGVRKYLSFLELVTNENLKKILPNTNTKEEAVKIYRKIYTEDGEKEFGAVAIEVEKVGSKF